MPFITIIPLEIQLYNAIVTIVTAIIIEIASTDTEIIFSSCSPIVPSLSENLLETEYRINLYAFSFSQSQFIFQQLQPKQNRIK